MNCTATGNTTNISHRTNKELAELIKEMTHDLATGRKCSLCGNPKCNNPKLVINAMRYELATRLDN